MKFKSFLVLAFVIFFSKISLSNENKLAYIDLNLIMNNSIAGKSITSQLEENHKKNILKLKKIEEKLKKEESEIISQKNVITKEEYEKKIIDLREKARKFRNERNENINNLNNQRLEATSTIINLIRPILSEYSEKNSISIIIDKKNVIIGKTTLDITNDILKIVDEKIGKIKLD
tara:strand:+ start:825 stop:1349 length:525 start_codon:yes stop_codon:yes gene_type:complete